MSAAEFAGVKALSCPFCGCADNMLYTIKTRGADFWYVECLNVNCQADGPRDLGRSGAIAKWNEPDRGGERDMGARYDKR
jgi:hypothetical protein